jgi:hypothetical protein
MEILDKNKYGSVNIKEILSFEKEFLISFPNDYKEFLLNHNGGVPSKNLIDFKENDTWTSTNVKIFLGIHSGPDWAQLKFFLLNERLKKGRVPFAYDDAGNAFIFLVSSHEVYFEDHETDELFFVSKSFSEFMSKLYAKTYNKVLTIDEAIELDDLEKFKELSSSLKIDYNSKNDYGRFWTEECAIYGANQILEYLVRVESVPLKQSSFYASRNGNSETQKLIKELKGRNVTE